MSKEQKSQGSIPVNKVQRAARFMKAGIKVGGNYVKHYAKKTIDKNLSEDSLHADNAKDVYDVLSELKGSALKVAQMMSMDKNLLPSAYVDKFQMAQYSAPPLSYPLVVKTFRKSFGQNPEDLFDEFSKDAINAASIGQVHKGIKNGKEYAIKIQYPGVADSIDSDLRLVKPFAVNLLKLSEKDVEHYMEEVRNMLVSETKYEVELQQSKKISEACINAGISNVIFPSYYPELSSDKVLTMDWITGLHLDKFLETNPSQEIRNKVGQVLWDFYDFQIHQLKEVHADPHPGNFIIQEDGTVGIIDFGCVKAIPDNFYDNYFPLIQSKVRNSPEELLQLFYNLQFIYEEDSEVDKKELFDVFHTMTTLLARPFNHETFDFGNESYFQEIFEFGQKSAELKSLKESKRPRGLRDGLYINRTYFGLYAMLNEIKANIQIGTVTA